MKIGRLCLFRVVYSHLDSLIAASTDISFEPVLNLLCKMGNVSNFFRCTTLEAIGQFFNINQVPFLTVGQASFLLNFLSRSHPKLHLPLSVNVCLQETLPLSPTNFVLFSDINDVDEQPLVTFLKTSDLTSLKHLTLNGVLIDFVHNLPLIPSLQSLTVENGYASDRFNFPSTLSHIKCLCVRFLSSTHTGWCYYTPSSLQLQPVHCDVSNLVALTKLSLHAENGVVIGLDKLPVLKSLCLNGINSCSSLHNNCKLVALNLTFVSVECFSTLQQSGRGVEGCKLEISRCSWSKGFPTAFNSSLVFFDITDNFDELDFSLDKLSALETLWIKNDKRTVVRINDYTRLNCLGVLNPNTVFEFGPQFHCFYLSKLVLAGLSTEAVSLLISFCPYLRHLVVINAKRTCSIVSFNSLVSKSQTKTPDMSLHLNFLELVNVEGFFRLLPSLPRLNTLTLDEVVDFSMTSIELFPNLSVLQLCRMKITDRSLHPNYSLDFLRLTRCNIYCPDFILPFERLQYFSLLFPKVFVNYLLVPRFLHTVHLHLCERFALINCFSSVAILFGDLQVQSTMRNEVDCLIEVFKSNHPLVAVNLSISEEASITQELLCACRSDINLFDILYASTQELLTS
ncbi:hypothetical protein RCL1_005814 [Eukaryota sp. TZLM3-RCL]